jgi:hypothetical protein
MTSINKVYLFLIITSISAKSLTTRHSYNTLIDENSINHATPHITNLLRNKTDGFSSEEKQKLQILGLTEKDGKFKAIQPTDLDQNYNTEHFIFYYTLEGNDAVESLEYIIEMGYVYEEVWKFYIDTLGYDPPPLGENNFYQIYVQNLPSFYFGITYTTDGVISEPSCLSFIKMRNNYSASQFSLLTELENIKVTAVHEFFHAIQFGYNCYEKLWMMEATAVWSEDKLYDNINDLYRYIPSWFNNPQTPLNDETSHMYGSFIFFQYLDEHHGGVNTIKSCWEYSRQLASSQADMSILAIDNALKDENSSFNQAHSRMRIANLIMSNNSTLGPYAYHEADGYKSVIENISQQMILFESGDDKIIQNLYSREFSSSYYDIISESSFSIELIDDQNNFQLTSVTKKSNQDDWDIRVSDNINIDPTINFEWIKLIITSNSFNDINPSYTFKIMDGYSEDFTFFPPYPNPSINESINFKIQVISPQIIELKLFNLLGERVWFENILFNESQIREITWNGRNQKGESSSSGVYFLNIKGKKSTKSFKLIRLK